MKYQVLKYFTACLPSEVRPGSGPSRAVLERLEGLCGPRVRQQGAGGQQPPGPRREWGAPPSWGSSSCVGRASKDTQRPKRKCKDRLRLRFRARVGVKSEPPAAPSAEIPLVPTPHPTHPASSSPPLLQPPAPTSPPTQICKLLGWPRASLRGMDVYLSFKALRRSPLVQQQREKGPVREAGLTCC